MDFLRQYRQMFFMALVTSPLLGIYNVTPISLLLSSDWITANVQRPILANSTFAFLIPAGFITVNALILWVANIWLTAKYRDQISRGKGNLRYLFSFVFVVAFLFIVQQVMSSIRPVPQGIGNMRYFPFLGAIVNNTIILILIELMLTRTRRSQLELEKANLELVNQRSRYDHLKQQIKPHFLFNALNTLKLLIKNKNADAESYVIKLSNFLRSSLRDQGIETISLRKDLEIFMDFMHLQQVRFPEAITFKCVIPEGIQDSKFLPLFTFQVLAENATKHNKLSREEPLCISVEYNDGSITFKNNINPKHDEADESTGIGLTNLSGRFQILTSSDIIINRTEKHFMVTFPVINHNDL